MDSAVVMSIMQELEERVAEHPLWASAGREELAAAGESNPGLELEPFLV